jgi:hypothetical protein
MTRPSNDTVLDRVRQAFATASQVGVQARSPGAGADDLRGHPTTRH